jgi:hypothetical protein
VGLKTTIFCTEEIIFCLIDLFVRKTVCPCPQEESKYRYRHFGSYQKSSKMAENHRRCFYGREKRGRTGGHPQN